TVQGNLIGTDYTGTRPVGNGAWGVEVQGPNNLIGGTVPGARNVLSANVASGLVFYLNTSHDNVVAGNFIGTDITGTKALGNQNGVQLFAGSEHNTVADNVVSGNALAGFYVGSDYTTIAHNIIGLDASAAAPVPNGQGIVTIGSSHNLIGGANSAADGN